MAFNIMDAIKNREQIAPPEQKQNGRMKIQYISVKNIVPALNNRNYYSTEKIESLKASIAVHGIKQNLLVKAIEGGKYELIAGECRWRCSSALYEEGKPEYEFVPCSVERPIDDLDQRILLTTINSTAREISDYEKGLQVQEMNEILDEYERRGATIEAPRRELIMKHLNLTSGQVGRYTAIHNHLSEVFMREYVKKEISVSVAYELSRLSKDEQAAAYQIYEKQGGLSIKDVKALRKEEDPQEEKAQEQGPPVFDGAKIGDIKQKADRMLPASMRDDFYDEYGRTKVSKYSRLQQYRTRDLDKTIDIKDERLPEGGFRLYMVQDKEDGLWRSSAASGFIEAGGLRWPQRDADNPVNSNLYPAFLTMEDAQKHAEGKMFCRCNTVQKEILKTMGYHEPESEQSEKSMVEMTPCEQCRSANPSCAEDHCCKTCEDPCNGQQICRINQPGQERQRGIDELNQREKEYREAKENGTEFVEAEPALFIVEGEAKPRKQLQEEPVEPGVLKIEAARFTMGVLEREIDKCGIEIRYAEEQGKIAKGALAEAKLEYLSGMISKVQADLFEMTGDDMFKEIGENHE